MKVQLIEILRCPASGQRLVLEQPQYCGSSVRSGWLVSADGRQRYPVRDFIPRFVGESNYADNFGMQWNAFRKTQLDSHSGHPISANRFWRSTGWSVQDIADKWVLDAGCGAGRFAEIALQAGANVVALDYSNAADACRDNLGHYPKLHVIQGDIYGLPFVKEFFPFVYSLGVLQHTPDVRAAFAALPTALSPGGRLCVDFYGKRLGTMLHAKYLVRPVTKRIAHQRLFKVLQSSVPFMLRISRALRRIPALGRVLMRAIPVANYAGVYPLDDRQLKEWALLDTFDMLAPQFDQPQKPDSVQRWLRTAGLVDVEVFRDGHLVGRGRKLT